MGDGLSAPRPAFGWMQEHIHNRGHLSHNLPPSPFKNSSNYYITRIIHHVRAATLLDIGKGIVPRGMQFVERYAKVW